MRALVEQAPENFLLLLIPVFPLLGACINAFFGERIQRAVGPKGVHTVAIAMPAISCVIAWIVFFQLMGIDPHGATPRAFQAVGWDWLHVGFLDARFAFWVDPLTSMMLLIITTIGTLIHLYSVGYMHGETSYWRFFCYLNLFLMMMLILVLGDNFLVMFIGWEGVGLASYLLIGFWYKELPNAGAGMKAFVVNRFGDACFVIGLFILFWGMQGSWQNSPDKAHLRASERYTQTEVVKAAEDAVGATPTTSLPEDVYATVTFPRLAKFFELEHERETFRLANGADEVRMAAWDAKHFGEGRSSLTAKTVWGMPILFWVCFLFFMGATAKSAQIPFYVWLPDAMAGPTPVSALIHAATMVTAGVYMIARLNFMFILSPEACTVIGLVAGATALFAASMGLFQYDIKKVLAYSTVSQLGFMFIGVGTGAYWAGVFHLLTHACFKACLFLGSGSVILGCHHEQDMRRMGGLKKHMPATAKTYFWACLAIAGFPIFAGFCSKDEVLWLALPRPLFLLPPTTSSGASEFSPPQ